MNRPSRRSVSHFILTRAFLAILALAVLSQRAHATCWPSLGGAIALLRPDCSAPGYVVEGEVPAFTAGEGACCAAGGKESCSRTPAAPGCLPLLHITPRGNMAVEASWRASGRSCGDFPLYTLDRALPPGTYKLGWAATFVVVPKGPLPTTVSVLQSRPLAVAAAAGSDELLIAWVARGPDGKARPAAARFDASLKRLALIEGSGIELAWSDRETLSVARTRSGWLMAAGADLIVVDATSMRRARALDAPTQLLSAAGAAPPLAVSADLQTPSFTPLADDGTPAGKATVASGGPAAYGHGGWLIAGQDGALWRLQDNGVARPTLRLPGRTNALAWTGKEMLAVGESFSRLSADGRLLASPAATEVPPGAVSAVGSDALVLVYTGNHLAVERIAADGRRGQAPVSRSAQYGAFLAIARLAGEKYLAAWTNADGTVALARIEPPPLRAEAGAAAPAPGACSLVCGGESEREVACKARPPEPPPPACGGAFLHDVSSLARCRDSEHGSAPAIAARGSEIGLAYVAGAPGPTSVRFLLLGSDLATREERRDLFAGHVRRVALASTRSGWLLAAETWRGVEVVRLDYRGAPRGAARVLQGAWAPQLVAGGGRRTLLLAQRLDGATLVELVRDDGGAFGAAATLAGAERPGSPLPAVATDSGFLIASWDALYPLTADGRLRPPRRLDQNRVLRALVSDGRSPRLVDSEQPDGYVGLRLRQLDRSGAPLGAPVRVETAAIQSLVESTGSQRSPMRAALAVGPATFLIAEHAFLIDEAARPIYLAYIPFYDTESRLSAARLGADVVLAWNASGGVLTVLRIPIPSR